MDNFRFYANTDIRFGKNQEECLPELLKAYGNRVLLTYGGGSIKKTGLYEKIKCLLKDFDVYELGGIAPNPRIESVYAGAKICKEKNIDVILAVGGGSTIDCSKVIAAAAFYDGNAWDLVLNPDKITKALPLVTVLTLAATGSEMNRGAVISNSATKEKIGLGNEHLLPRASILNPENTFTVPANQTAAGSADILSHLWEIYFAPQEAFIPDVINEGLQRAVIRYAPAAIAKPDDYEARAQLMWASSLALNDLCTTGKGCAWSCHPIEHELSAYYDITHGVGLAILTPRWMRYVLREETVGKFAAYARNVWGIPDTDDWSAAHAGIEKTEEFLTGLGIPMTLGALGISAEFFPQMAAHAVKFGWLQYAYIPLNENDVVEILKSCL